MLTPHSIIKHNKGLEDLKALVYKFDYSGAK
jgi:hypothetical protein